MAGAQMRVLIVDDMTAVIKRLSRLIDSAEDFAIAGTAMTGYEAIAIAIRVRPDVVLMDVDMETRLAGVYACREIRKLSPETRIILMLDRMEDEIIFRAFQNGAHNVIAKSAGDQLIHRAILNAHANRSTLDSDVAPAILREFRRMKTMEDSFRYLIGVVVRLTPAELEVLKLLASGMNQRDVAKLRFIEPTTLKTHITHILRKFNAPNIGQVIEIIQSTGFFSLIQ